MSHLTNWLREFRRYHCDDRGAARSSSATTIWWTRRGTWSSVGARWCARSRSHRRYMRPSAT